MTPSWAPTSATTPPCPCRWATHRAPTRAARSSDWGGRYMTPSIAHRALQLTGLLPGVMAKARPLNTCPTARRKPATEHPGVPAPRLASAALCGFGGFHCVVLCFETGHLFVAISGLELMQSFCLSFLRTGVTAPSSPTMPRFLPRTDPPGREHGFPWWDSEAVHFLVGGAVGGAGPKSFRFFPLFYMVFVVCEPRKLQAVSFFFLFFFFFFFGAGD
ncbi:rCG29189 [Rattus norvegicus]|nr:rCG29189 [Rattus norvegicus]